MNQIEWNNNTLTLRVKKSPVFIRGLLFFVFVFTAIIPIVAFVLNFINGNEFRLMSVFSLIFFGFLSFRVLRVALWNTYGKEIIVFSNNKIVYTTDFKWFKDKVKEYEFKKLSFTSARIGYEENEEGLLIIHIDSDSEIQLNTVTKIKLPQLTCLIHQLNETFS